MSDVRKSGGGQGRILVIRGGAIGDFILTLPVLAALRRAFPQAGLEVLGYPRIAELATLAGVADEVRSIEDRGLSVFFAPNAKLSDSWVEYFGRFSVIISYLYDPDGYFAGNVKKSTAAVFIQGPHRPSGESCLHASECLLQPLRELAVFDADPVPRIPIRDESNSVLPIDRDFVLAVHPGSGSPRKNWPEARWSDFLERLALESPCRLLLVGGEAEGDRLGRLAQRWPAERFAMARSLGLPSLAARLAGCTHFLGHDSGITHLAAAVGCPVLALWGESDDSVWRPRGESITILKPAAGLETLSVEELLRQVRPFLSVQKDA